ncbi:3-deoxy-D-manno-octulosonic acid transferase [Ulvibacter litoralis]|uniref:3-deoxy-D-manno-octulosonic acid transferase n=1 Tax=Ulvibacter litoralis TaxID=227084 RepID=A0A1G7GAC9_9FLAO|nr:glycosyltransferase N-terminal domain-containing protein [Ulvibacter litoralis]GHC57057.1 3-deoxy-D-manno-octulosonic acid transferase [Ulvibacter litoralis]SDE85086.1 3-deoxy-D-manno-octulosonic-acid transferase [Ulvibacter litoralis]
MKLFVSGRKDVFNTLSENIAPNETTLWFHCASLGEFEQGVPIMNACKQLLPNHKIVVSFFSPSGYEVKKKDPIADVVVYLPLDTLQNAKKFIAATNPSLAIFIKYEFWPNYLFELQKNKIPTLLVSGLFRSKQSFFKPYGGFMRKALGTFDHLFLQNENSKDLLSSIGISNFTVSGDTRFDRVSHQIEQNNTLDFMEQFKGDSLCIVCGSTWTEDEVVLLDSINAASENVKFVIAPHKIEPSKIHTFRKNIQKKTALYSEVISLSEVKKTKNLSEANVFIIDMVGLLTKIYNYADIAYVGGAMGATGLHNILEPATFGVPIVIGKNFEKFPEAKKLQQLAGLFSVSNAQECTEILEKLTNNASFRNKTGMIAGHFINNNTGATKTVMDYIEKLDSLKSKTNA